MPQNHWGTVWLLLLQLTLASTDLMAEDPQAVLQNLLKEIDPKIRVAVWVGNTSNEPFVEHQSDMPLASASAIKTALLVELFARFHKGLDEVPREKLKEILQDEHPAIRHFSETQRREIKLGLSNKSIRQIGRMMMGSDAASNLVYNAAANVTIALLDGPEGATQAIHKRSVTFHEIMVRRYMLAKRDEPGDNMITARSLASLWQSLAGRRLNGIDAATHKAIIDAILANAQRFDLAGDHHFKGGSLDSLPIVRVESGSWVRQDPVEATVYVVIVQQDELSDTQSPIETGKRLGELAKLLTTKLLGMLKK